MVAASRLLMTAINKHLRDDGSGGGGGAAAAAKATAKSAVRTAIAAHAERPQARRSSRAARVFVVVFFLLPSFLLLPPAFRCAGFRGEWGADFPANGESRSNRPRATTVVLAAVDGGGARDRGPRSRRRELWHTDE